jgi:hypothetical protein
MLDIKHQTAFVQQIMKAALDSFDGTPYQMSLKQKQHAFDVLVVKQPKTDGPNCSRAGRTAIRINLSYWQIKNIIRGEVQGGYACHADNKLDGHVYWSEYRSFNADPRCGGMFVKNGDVDHGNLIQVLHETAHYVQFALLHVDRSRWRHMRRPHGDGFRTLYSMLRDRFCNDPAVREQFLEECNMLAMLSQLDDVQLCA